MSCSGGNCSCGKKENTMAEESIHLVQLPGSGSILPTIDWSKAIGQLSVEVELVEVRLKNSRKAFFRNIGGLELAKNDRIVVESGDGHNLGTVSLAGNAAKKQYECMGGDESSLNKVYRKATAPDLERWLNAKRREHGVLQEARKIAFEQGVEIGISDVEFRGDGLSLTIFHTAAKSGDLRDLVRRYASAFSVNLEMHQIGVRHLEIAGEYN